MFVKAIFGAAVAATAVSAAPIAHGAHPHSFKIPTVEEAAAEARTLVNRESLANLATLDASHNNIPVSFMEYYADCDNDGSLTLLSLNIGSSFRNIAKGSPATLSIRVGDHAINDVVDIDYPGSIPTSPAGSPRISLRGKFVDVEDASEHERLAKCFVSKHPDSKWWLPGNPIHGSKWSKFEVEGVYFLGGFGDRAFIGDIPQELYSSAQPQAFPIKAVKKCNKKKNTVEESKSTLNKLWTKVNQFFDDLEEQIPEVAEKPHLHHQDKDFHHDENNEQILISHHGSRSDLSEEELFAIHHNGMSFEEFEAAHKAHNLERRGDFDPNNRPTGSQIPFIVPQRLSNKEAGKRMKAILDAQKKGTY
ncbi:hypothetical protein D0Z03_001252 [Geotrichum reessii]|nr:hypothetical protein D0Z03_001252 [Galactomyces reessii]